MRGADRGIDPAYDIPISFSWSPMENHMPPDPDFRCREPGMELAGPRFLISRGHRGGWIVSDRLDLVGGVFVSEAAARHYAFEESGGRHDQCDVISDTSSAGADLRRVA
jgi:hypothetical protein